MIHKIVYIIIGFGIAFMFFPHAADDSKKGSILGVETQQAEARPEKASPEMALNLSAPVLSATSALAFDVSSGTVLYSKNLEERHYIASLTKLMTALVTIKHSQLDDIATVNQADLYNIGNTAGLVPNEQIKIRDLLKSILILSGNDAAMTLARHVGGTPDKFIDMMNAEAESLKLTGSNFSNPVGWDRWGGSENYSTAADMHKIVNEFLKHDVLKEMSGTRQTVVTSVDEKYTHNLRTTNQLLLDNPNIKGIKTGYTSGALGSLIALYETAGTEVVTIVLDSKEREEDSNKLLEWVFTVYRW